jgi:hypothetical protein
MSTIGPNAAKRVRAGFRRRHGQLPDAGRQDHPVMSGRTILDADDKLLNRKIDFRPLLDVWVATSERAASF